MSDRDRSARALTPAETALAASVFGDAIDYAPVRLARRKWAFFQPRDVVMAPRGCIHFHPGGDLWCELRGDRVLMSGHAVTYLKGEIEVG